MESLEFSIYNILSSANSDVFTSCFLILMMFTSFYFPVALARTPNTMLKKSDESGHPCFFLDFRLKALSFSLLSIMSAVGLSYVYMAFIMLRYKPSIFNLLRVLKIINEYNLYQKLPLYLLR